MFGVLFLLLSWIHAVGFKEVNKENRRSLEDARLLSGEDKVFLPLPASISVLSGTKN